LQAARSAARVCTTRKYPAVITFTEGGDALDEEAHAFRPTTAVAFRKPGK